MCSGVGAGVGVGVQQQQHQQDSMEQDQERGGKRPVPGGDDDQDLLMGDRDSAQDQQQQERPVPGGEDDQDLQVDQDMPTQEQQQQGEGASTPVPAAPAAAAVVGQRRTRPWEVDIQNNSHRTCCGECQGIIRAGQLKVRKT